MDTGGMDIVSGGPVPENPIEAPPRQVRDRSELLLRLLVVGVFLVVAGTAFTGWMVYQSVQDERFLYCSFLGDGSGDDRPEYDDLSEREQQLVDRFGCDVSRG